MRRMYFGRKVTAAVIALSSLLSINIAPLVGAVDQNCTWTGATDLNFSTATNWSGCGGGVPGTGDNLVFDATGLAASATLNNDIVGLSVKTLSSLGSNAGYNNYTLSGNPITVTTGITSGNTSFTSIDNDLVLSGSTAINLGTQGVMSINGIVSGTSNVTVTGGSLYLSGANTFSGSVSTTSNYLFSDLTTSLGAAGNAITAGAGSTLTLGGCTLTTATFPYGLSLTGAGRSANGTEMPKLIVGGKCAGGGGGADDTFMQSLTADTQNITLSGAVALGSDITFAGIAKQTTLTGALSGNFKINMLNQYGGLLTVSGSSNTTGTPNGSYAPGKVTATLSDNQPTRTVFIGNNAVVTIDGTRGDTDVQSGGKLMGVNGTVGVLSVYAGGIIAPGHSPGCINSGNLTLAGTYEFEVGGTTACTGYDQINVTGTVNVTGATLKASIYNNFKAAVGQKYVIVNNDGSDAVTGTFAGLAEGATFAVGDGQFRISYVGGTGNDIELTVLVVPSVPNTGFQLLTANPFLTLTAAVVGAGALMVAARRVRA